MKAMMMWACIMNRHCLMMKHMKQIEMEVNNLSLLSLFYKFRHHIILGYLL